MMLKQVYITYIRQVKRPVKVKYVHDLLKIVGNSVPNVQINFISNDLLRS